MTTDLTQTAGQLVDRETGEIIAEPGIDLVEMLDTYHRAYGEAVVARLDYEQRRAAILEQLEDPEILEAERRLASAELVVAGIAESLAELRPTDDPLRSVSLDTGAVRVTWGKARETWRYGVKAKDLAARDPELAEQLRVTRSVSKTPKPRITVRLEES